MTDVLMFDSSIKDRSAVRADLAAFGTEDLSILHFGYRRWNAKQWIERRPSSLALFAKHIRFSF
jgi:hypothetical protein